MTTTKKPGSGQKIVYSDGDTDGILPGGDYPDGNYCSIRDGKLIFHLPADAPPPLPDIVEVYQLTAEEIDEATTMTSPLARLGLLVDWLEGGERSLYRLGIEFQIDFSKVWHFDFRGNEVYFLKMPRVCFPLMSKHPNFPGLEFKAMDCGNGAGLIPAPRALLLRLKRRKPETLKRYEK